MSNKNSKHYFLRGGGEMGELIRAKDWSKTSLGDPDNWPQSLRTMVAVMLDNPFGMYIAWGNDYTQLYNDAYRPILGATKHPQALGVNTKETFSEIWDNIIGSMFDDVMKGKAVGFPDFMLPLNRNGFVEECYFDFAYSPIRKDDGEVGGVLVTVIETTDKKKEQSQLVESTNQLKFAIDAADFGTWDYNPATNKFTSNNRLKTWFGLSASEEIELHHATDAIAEKDKGRIINAIKKVLDYSSGGIYDEEYSIINPLTNKEIIVHGKGRAWFNDEKIAYRFTGVLQEVTEKVLSRKSIEESEARFRAIADDAPVFIFLAGENAEVEYLNKTWRDYTGISTNDSKGRAWAEITHIDDIDPATKIYMDGFNKRESCSFENRQKGIDGIYRTILWKATPRFALNGEFIGMMGVGLDIHERKKSEEKLLESEKQKEFLLKLSDTLRQQTNPDDIEEAVTNLALDFVGVDLCYFNIIEGDNVIIRREAVRGRLTSVVGLYPISGYPLFKAILDNGHPLVVDNVKTSLKLDAALKQICVDLQNIASINVPVIKNGKPVAMLSLSQSEPRNWTDAEVQVAIAIAERTWTAIERTKAEEALLKSEEKYRTLFNSIDQGFLLGEVIRNNEGKGIDYFVHEVNATYEKQTGINIEMVLGKTVLQAFPTIDKWWIETYASVVDNQYPVKFEKFFEFTNRWFEIKALPTGKEMFIILFTDITERILAVEKIKESENNLKLMIHQAPVAISIFRGMDYTMEIANKHALELLGRTDQEVIGKPIFITMPELLSQGIKELLDDVRTTGKRFAMAERAVQLLRNGIMENVFINFSYEPLYDKDEKITGIMAVAIDVTEQVEVRKKVELNEEKLNIVIEASELGTYELNMKTKEPTYSKRYLEILGGYKEDLKLSHAQLLEHLHPGDFAIREKAFKKAIDTGYLHYEARLIWKDQSIHWMEGKGKVFYDENNEAEKLIGTIRDITDEKNHEQELKESEVKFRLLADSMPQHIWTADLQGNLNYYNQSVFDYSGLTLEQINKDGWIQIVHPDDREENIRQWINAITTGEDFLFEHRFRRHDGEYRWQLSRAIPQRDAKGKIQMWVGTSTDIEEQKTFAKQLEEQVITRTAELKASEEKFYNLFNLSPICKTLSDVGTGKIVMVNDAFTKLFGYSREVATGKSSADLGLLDPEAREIMINELKTNRKVENRELRFVKKSGKGFIALASAEIINLGDKQFFLSAINDISEIKKAERLIKRKNTELENKTIQLEEAQQLAHIGSWEWDVVTNKIEWSDELFRIFGLTPQEFKADYENYLRYIHPDDREYVNSTVQLALKDHQPYSLFHKVACADGKVRILSATGKVITDGIGTTIKMSGTAQDVTEQKNYEEELKISEERFYKIFDNNPVAMYLSEIKTNKIKYANNRFYKAFGFTEKDVIGRSSEELNLMDPEETNRVTNLLLGYLLENRTLAEIRALSAEEREAILLKLKQSEKMKDFEMLYTRTNGEKFPAIVSFEVIRIGVDSYTVTSCQDITERKKAEALLRSQNDQLEKMNKELESFAYISSHDLQEPLRKIQTFATRITEKEENNLSDYGKDMFNRMQDAAKRMQTLIQDLLAYSRTNTNERRFVTTNLNEIVAEVKEDLKEELNEKHATIEAKQLTEADIIPFQFRQLMHNLIGNSLKFSNPANPPHIKIKSEIAEGINFNNEKLLPQNKYCYITVSDNGIGFDQRYSEKIFEVFQRLHGKSEYIGTGIGLSIVKKIVDNHHGFITATGEPNKGATFEIYIPATINKQ